MYPLKLAKGMQAWIKAVNGFKFCSLRLPNVMILIV